MAPFFFFQRPPVDFQRRFARRSAAPPRDLQRFALAEPRPGGVRGSTEDYLRLSTINSATGQEWQSVFLAQCGGWMSAVRTLASALTELEEERDGLYVAMTAPRIICS